MTRFELRTSGGISSLTNFATLTKFQKPLAIFVSLFSTWQNIFFCSFGEISFLSVAKYGINNTAIWSHWTKKQPPLSSVPPLLTALPRPRINRPSTRQLARAGNLCLFTAANEDFIDIFLI